MESFIYFPELPLELQLLIFSMDPILVIKATQLCHTTRELVRRDYLLAKCSCPISRWEIRRYLNTNPKQFSHFTDSSTCNIFIRRSTSDRIAEFFSCNEYEMHPHLVRLYSNNTGEPSTIAYCSELGRSVTYRNGIVTKYPNPSEYMQETTLDLTDPAHSLDLFSQFEIMSYRLKNKRWASRLVRHKFNVGISILERTTSSRVDSILRILIIYNFLVAHLILLEEREISIFTELMNLRPPFNPMNLTGFSSHLEITTKEEEIPSMKQHIEEAIIKLSEN